MKRLIIVCVIIVGIVVTCVYSYHRVKVAREQIEAYTNAVFTSLEQQDNETINRLVGELASYWKEEEHYLVRFVRHGQVDEITKSMSRLEPLARYNAHQELVAELSSILWQINHICESERFTIGNIL